MPRRRFKYLLDPVMAVVSVTKYGTAGYELGWLIGMEQNLGSTSLVAQLVKNPPAMQETWVPFLGWEDPLERGKGTPLQYSGLENSVDSIVPGVAKSWTRLSDFHFWSWSG